MSRMRARSTVRLGAIVAAAVLAAAGHGIGAQPQPARTGRPLAIEDYYRIQTVANPTISPDGRWVTFTISTRVEDDNGTETQNWLVPADGSAPPTRITHHGRDVTGTRWTDDGRLQYLAERRQWTIDPGSPGTMPREVAGAIEPAGRGGRGGRGGGRGGASAGMASPDARWLARTMDKPRLPAEPAAASDFERRHLSEDRFKGVIFDWKDFQRDGQPFPAPNPTTQPAQQVVAQAASGSDSRVLADLDLRPTGIVWHPNGQMIAFTADPNWRDELKYNRADIWTATLDGKTARLTDDGHVHGDLAFSPDGTYLSYVRDPGTDLIIAKRLNHGGPSDLYIRPVSGGEPVNLTAKWDLEPGSPRWSPDGRFLYFTAAIGGETHLFRAAVPGGGVEQVTKGERRLNGITFDKAFTKIAFTVGLHDAPPDVYVANIDGSGERRLTNVHKDLVSEIAFSRAERLRWPSYDSTQIEGWITFPHGYDAQRGRYPLIVFSHGGPHAATGYTFDFKKQYFAANGYFVLDTNFRSSTGYGEAFKWATWGEWGKKDGEDVMSGVDYVLERYPIDPRRVGHTGHSYGGFMTNWLITQYPDRLAAAITGAGISNWISDYGTADIYRTKETEFYGTPWDPEARERMIKQSPLTYAGRVKTPTLFVHGEVDQRVPYEEAEQMYFALKRRGVPAKMIQYKDQPHGIGGHWNNVHRMISELQWWNRYLKGAAAPGTAASSGKR